MRRLVMLMALGLAAAFGQTGGAGAAEDRIIMDAVIEVLPGPEYITGHCLMLDPGTLKVTVGVVDRPIEGRVDRAVSFVIGAAGAPRGTAEPIDIGTPPTDLSVAVDGRLLCYSLHAEGTMDGNTSGVGPTIAGIRQRYGQLVALRLVWSPPTV